MNIQEIFDKYGDEEFLKFDRVRKAGTKRADLHAFLLLDAIVPGTHDMVSAAEHDEIFLSVTPEELAAVASEEQIVELIRCGVRYDSHHDCLQMFV